MVTLTNLASLSNQTSAVNTINGNNEAIEQEFEKVFYRDGSNSVLGDIDMNGKRLLNLPAPVFSTDPLRLADIETAPPIEFVIASEDVVWGVGNSTAIIASKAKIDWERDDPSSAYPPENLGGLWPSAQVYYRHAINAEFDATNAPVAASLASPASTMMISSHNKGSDAIVIPLQTISGVHVNGKEAANLNTITYCSPGLTNVKLKGVEIDLQPGAGSTISEAFGLAINCFTMPIPGPALYIESIFGGEWGTGILIGKLSNIGSGLSPAGGNPSMGTLVDTGIAQYQIDAIKLSNTHKVRFNGTSSAHAKVFMDGSNFWKFVLGSNSLVWRDNSDTSTLMSLSTTGDLALEAGGTIRFTSGLVTTSATAGGATALPATPQGYLTVNIGGTNRKIPFYA